MTSFEQECLEEHNKYRALHGSPPLALNATLCAYATEWAQNLAAKNSMQHRSNNRYGENLYMASGCNVSGRDAAKAWYDEVNQYNYGRPGFTMHTGHFTQVVWKDSKQLGVGIAKRGSSTWVVANYDPQGNFMGRFPENVPQRIR